MAAHTKTTPRSPPVHTTGRVGNCAGTGERSRLMLVVTHRPGLDNDQLESTKVSHTTLRLAPLNHAEGERLGVKGRKHARRGRRPKAAPSE